jgi:hypothetical protein
MTAALFAALLVCMPPQVGRVWTFNDLVTESDLVVIGKALNTRDTGRKAKHPDLRPDVPVVEFESGIQVLATLKAPQGWDRERIRTVILRHFQIDMEEWRREHPAAPGHPAPGLVNAGEPLTLTPGNETYLLFLKRTESGWEPTTGHVFPGQSVFPLGGATRIGG